MLNKSEILVPARAYVHFAPVGTAAPADAVIEPADPWVLAGHTSPDSLSFNTEPEFQGVPSHQSDFDVRRFQTSDAASISVDLLQWNAANIKAVYGGGTITAVGATGNFKFVPPKLGVRDELSCLVTIVDGTKRYRWVYVATQQVEGVSNEMQKGQEARLPLRLAVLGDDLGEPWYFLTNDPAFDPA